MHMQHSRLGGGCQSLCSPGHKQGGGRMQEGASTAQPQQQQPLLQHAVRTLLEGLGEDPSREGLLNTPKRVAKALLYASQGYRQAPAEVLGDAYFNERIVLEGGNGLVVVRDIDFASTSEETLLPFHGRCHIAYVPANGVVLGLSKLARLTKVFAKRLQQQDQLGSDIACTLHKQLQCQGVAVVIQAQHLSMWDAQPPCVQTTACVTGCFSQPQDSPYFEELLALLGLYGLPPSCVLHARSTALPSPPQSPPSALLPNQNLSMCDAPLPPSTPDPCGSIKFLSQHGSDRTLLSEQDASELNELADSSSSEKGDSEAGCTCDSSVTLDAASCLRLPYALGALSCLKDALPHPNGHTSAGMGSSTGMGGEHRGMMLRSLSAQGCHLQPAAAQHSTQQHDRCGTVDAMEHAVQLLLVGMGENPMRTGLLGSAHRYVTTLLAATSGYSRHLPLCPHQQSLPLPLSSQQQPLPPSQSPQQQPLPSPQTSQQQPLPSPQTSQQQPLPLLQSPQQQGTSQQGAGDSSSRSGCTCCTSTAVHTVGQAGQGLAQQGQEVTQQLQGGGTLGNAGLCWHTCMPFNSHCEHHMLPFYGHVHVLYSSPAAKLAQDEQPGQVGSGVAPATVAAAQLISEVVSIYTQRLQVQERITHQVADGVQQVLGAGAVVVVVDAAHMCMVARGVENHAGRTTSMAVRGAAVGDAKYRARALQACRAAGLA